MMLETLDSLRPGEPLEVFANTLNGPIFALYATGRWAEVSRFRQAVEEVRQRTQRIEGVERLLLGSYQALLLMALSREDQAEIEALEALVRRLSPDYREKAVLPFVAFYRDGDFRQFEVGRRGLDLAGLLIMLFVESEQRPPEELMQQGNYYADDFTLRASNVARALMEDDDAALARAIDEAEEHQLVVHAAHMRIVLARRTGDRGQLERARPVLERLEDRLFLRKLKEVEQGLQTR